MKKYYENNNLELYNCDCLELLKTIDDESINLIYCDIPYNTNIKFNSFNDNLGNPQQAVDYYRPRFKEMRRVLKNNGAIFIHCSRRLDCYIGMLLDEIFGYDNYRNKIYRKHSKERNFYNNFDSLIDVIFYYCKDGNKYVFNKQLDSKQKLVPLFASGYNGNSYNQFTINNETINLNEINYHIIVREKELLDLIKNNQISLVNGLPYMKSNTISIPNIWDEEEMLDKYDKTNFNNSFDTPKPIAIVKKIIETCSNPGDVIADFFVGSGTTMIACKQTNRKGIFCDINEENCKYIEKKLSNEDN